MKRILHVSSFYEKGGAESVFRDTLAAIKNTNQFENYTAYARRKQEEPSPSIELETWEGRSVCSPINYIFNYSNYKQLLKHLEIIKPDIIHVHNIYSGLSPSILLALKKYKNKNQNLRLIQTIHDYHLVCPSALAYDFRKGIPCTLCVGKKYKLAIFSAQCDKGGGAYSFLKGLRSFLAHVLLAHRDVFDLFIAPSHTVFESLVADGISERKIKVVRNPIAGMVTTACKSKRRRNIVYFGRFAREKNLSLLIESFSDIANHPKMKGWDLTLIGEGACEQELVELIQSLGLKGRVDILPFMARNELYELIELSSLMVIPSFWYETFGLVVYESAMLGVLPIVSNMAGLKEGVEWLSFGKTFEPTSREDLANVILENSYERDEGAEHAAQMKIIENLNFNAYAAQLMKAYQN